MEYYKLYCLIHRRTDWERLYLWERSFFYREEEVFEPNGLDRLHDIIMSSPLRRHVGSFM